MIRIAQFGEGNFLRAFVDTYFDTLNKEGYGPYAVSIVKPIPFGSLENFHKQKNAYHTVLRGCDASGAVEEIYPIDVVDSVIDPFNDYESYLTLARDPELSLIVSNTTEAGIVYSDDDIVDDFSTLTYPAKLTLFLYERFKNALGGVVILPCELIDQNATKLSECVDRYIEKFALGEDFYRFNKENNSYLNTLVDRIVSGFPRDEAVREHLFSRIGAPDELLTIGEPFGLWAVENGQGVDRLLVPGHHNIDVVITDDINYYKKRKVRILNGAHTGMVPMALWYGKTFVADAMADPKTRAFLMKALAEIIPYVSPRTEDTERFAGDVLIRFENPYLNHSLVAILLNSVSKWQARNMPSLLDYYHDNGQLAPYLTYGLSYLVALYSTAQRLEDGSYIAKTPAGEVKLSDEEKYLAHFASGKSVEAFLLDFFPTELTAIPGLVELVTEQVVRIRSGEELGL